MTYVFGPVPSRRLGLSLGIDLVPAKTCSYDCLYCQVGRTTSSTLEPEEFCRVSDVIAELGHKLERVTPDVITLSGSGEPTLHSRIDQIINLIKEMTDRRIALLTNGSLLWREDVRERVSGAHVIMPTLSSVFEATFQTIHRPHPDLRLQTVIGGIKELRKSYRGQLYLEVIFLAGINDSEKEVAGLRQAIREISPDRVQLNTVVRPPADEKALSLDRKRLEDIKSFFGEVAEIIVGSPSTQKAVRGAPSADLILDMAKRRPVRVQDVASALNEPVQEVEDLMKGLLIKGALSKQEHGGDIYYTCRS